MKVVRENTKCVYAVCAVKQILLAIVQIGMVRSKFY